MNIEYFKIEKLFNQYNVTLSFDNEVNIFLGENGMGKTTILNCLYAVLSGRLEKLDNIVFERLEVKFANSDNLVLERKDLTRYLEENFFDLPRYHSRLRYGNLNNIFSEKEKMELKAIAKDGTYDFRDIKSYILKVSEVFGIPIRAAENTVE